MKEIVALTYKEINNDILKATLKNDGVVFIRLSSRQAKAFIQLNKRSEVIKKYKLYRPNWFIRIFNLIMAFISLIKVVLFHARLMELVLFQEITKVRYSWEIQTNSSYVLIFS